MREFVTSVEDAFEVEDNEGEQFVLDGETLTYYKPTDGQMVLYMAATGRHSTENDRSAATINFFLELFDRESKEHLVARLMDRTDPFGVKKIYEIIAAMMEDWSGRPTQSSSASASSERNGGRKSTPRTRKSISSVSPSTVS